MKKKIIFLLLISLLTSSSILADQGVKVKGDAIGKNRVQYHRGFSLDKYGGYPFIFLH